MDLNKIERIKISDIEPNPDNPRKDLGDLTELADSIRAKGILENLVVVRNPGNFQRVALPDGDSAETWRDATEPKYRAVIGHRRLAAAKLAGLDSVPCVVRDMTRDEAIAAMLAENGQRAALTPYEEALGFQQLSLDMGKSVKQIHDMTGFGETTIRSRLKLAKLDGGKVRAGVERGATLCDFAALDKIASPALKDEVLDKAGTPDFQDALKSAVRKEQRRELLKRWAAEADAFAEPIRAVNRLAMEIVRNYCAYGGDKLSVERPEDAGETKYYYIVDEPYLSLYRDRTEKDNAAKAAREAAEAARKAREAALGDITERHFTLRKEFVAGFPCAPASLPAIMLYAAELLVGDGRIRPVCNLSLLAELLGAQEEIDFENDSRESVKNLLLQSQPQGKARSGARLTLCAAYALTDNLTNGYWKGAWNQEKGAWESSHTDNPALDRLYRLLADLGYQMSAEEIQMRDGTHPLFEEGAT